MSENSKHTPLAKTLFFVGMVVVGLMGALLAWFWNALPPELPWLYSLPWGEQQLIEKTVFAAGLGGLVVVLFISKAISTWVNRNDEIVNTTLMMGGLLAVVLYSASFLRVIFLFIDL